MGLAGGGVERHLVHDVPRRPQVYVVPNQVDPGRADSEDASSGFSSGGQSSRSTTPVEDVWLNDRDDAEAAALRGEEVVTDVPGRRRADGFAELAGDVTGSNRSANSSGFRLNTLLTCASSPGVRFA